MDWIDLAEDRDRWRTLVNAVMNLRVSQNAGNFLTSLEPVSFSGGTVLYGVG
jgi:CRISPR/Cas system-associated protein Cas7 (RAMP superfamily)